MGCVYAFVNMKGGVGKTTASVLFAETLARYDRRVLFVDLDAQASGSFAIAGYEGLLAANQEKRNLCGFLSSAIARGSPPQLDSYLLHGASNVTECGSLDLAAAHPELRLAEREFVRATMRGVGMLASLEKSFQKARRPIFDEIRRLAPRYDAVVIDCPPGISLFVEAGVFAADVVVCPTAPEPLATLGLETILARVYGAQWFLTELIALNRPAPAFRILFSRVDPRSDRHRREIERVETMVEKLDWREHDVALIEDQIEFSPALAGAFDDPDLERPFAQRYGAFEGRAADIASAITTSVTLEEAARA